MKRTVVVLVILVLGVAATIGGYCWMQVPPGPIVPPPPPPPPPPPIYNIINIQAFLATLVEIHGKSAGPFKDIESLVDGLTKNIRSAERLSADRVHPSVLPLRTFLVDVLKKGKKVYLVQGTWRENLKVTEIATESGLQNEDVEQSRKDIRTSSTAIFKTAQKVNSLGGEAESEQVYERKLGMVVGKETLKKVVANTQKHIKEKSGTPRDKVIVGVVDYLMNRVEVEEKLQAAVDVFGSPPTDPEIFAKKYHREKRWEEAKLNARLAMEQRDDSVYVLILADCWLQQGNPREAEKIIKEDFNGSKSRLKGFAEARVLLGYCLLSQGDTQGALDYFELGDEKGAAWSSVDDDRNQLGYSKLQRKIGQVQCQIALEKPDLARKILEDVISEEHRPERDRAFFENARRCKAIAGNPALEELVSLKVSARVKDETWPLYLDDVYISNDSKFPLTNVSVKVRAFDAGDKRIAYASNVDGDKRLAKAPEAIVVKSGETDFFVGEYPLVIGGVKKVQFEIDCDQGFVRLSKEYE